MTELANLVFKANELRDQVLKDKFSGTVYKLEQDQKIIRQELQEASAAYLTEDQRYRIQEKAEELSAQYGKWLASLTESTQNMDSYITASNSSVSGFRKFITEVMNEGSQRQVRSKRVTVIDCIPAASKKVTSPAEVDKVVDAIRTKLLEELKNNDEINLL